MADEVEKNFQKKINKKLFFLKIIFFLKKKKKIFLLIFFLKIFYPLSPFSLVFAEPPISYVTYFPSLITCSVAKNIAFLISGSPRYSTIQAPDNMAAVGFTLFIPLYFGALPCAGSNIA